MHPRFSISLSSVILFLAVALLPASATAQFTVSTVAGGGPNNMPALSACLGSARSVATDPSGNLYIGNGQILVVKSGTEYVYKPGGAGPFPGSYVYADSAGNIYFSAQNQVYKVSATTGTATLMAGTGKAGYSGDNGLAVDAELNGAAAIATDSSGNIYIADEWNNVIRKVDISTGYISTIAGTAGSMGGSGDGGLATAALLDAPVGIAIDASNNIYISDVNNRSVREITAATGYISTLVSTTTIGTTAFMPSGIAVDSAANVFIADPSEAAIWEYSATAKTVSVVAGKNGYGYSGDGGLATNATLDQPFEIALDSSGNLYTTDNWDGAIRKVDATTGLISSPVTGLSFDSRGVAVDSEGNLYYVDKTGSVVDKLNVTTNAVTVYAGGGTSYVDGGAATSTSFGGVYGIRFDASDDLFIVDSGYCNVREVDAKTGYISTVAGSPPVSEYGGLYGDCDYTGDGSAATSATLSWPTGVFVDTSGNIYIADNFNSVIRKVDVTTGKIATVAGNGAFGYTGDGGLATNAELNFTYDVVVDSSGNIFFSDMFNYVIRKVDASTSIISTVAGTGMDGYNGDGGEALATEFTDVTGLALEYPDLLVGDPENGRVRKIANLLVPTVIPTVIVNNIANITQDSATVNAGVTASSSTVVTARGACWSTSTDPALGGNCVADSSGGTGTFSVNLTGLTENTLYYVRAYATSAEGTGYSSDTTFTTLTLPVLTTSAVTNIAATSATGGGNISSDGGATVTARGVCWNTSGSPTTADTCTNDGTGAGTFVSSITGLTGGTLYYVRAYATNSVGTAYGSDVQFTTIVPVLATVATTAVTNITPSTATSGGDVTSDGGATVTARGVCWNTSGSPTTADTCTNDGTGAGTFVSSITGLASSTLYHVRAYATNSVGTAYGSDVQFTTSILIVVPTLTTTAVSAITTTTATSGGNITSNGGDVVTAYGVCWGAAANPTSANTCTDDGAGTGAYVSAITGLTAGSRYHVRAYATNSAGTAYGNDIVFTTSTGVGPFAYITNTGDNTVTVIDTLTNLVYGNPISVGDIPLAVAVSSNAGRVFVANLLDRDVMTIDGDTKTLTSPTVKVGYMPMAIAINPVSGLVYTADETTEDLEYFDPSLSSPTAGGTAMGIGTHPAAVAVGPDGTRIYVAEFGSDAVVTLDSTSYSAIGSAVSVGDGPDALAITPDGATLFVANGNTNTITLIDTATNTVIGSPLTVGNSPSGIAIDATGAYAWVTNYSDDTVSVIDLATNTVSGDPIDVGQGPWGIALNPSGTSVYVANSDDGTVTVLDAATRQITATILVGSGPAAFGQFIRPPLSVVTAAVSSIAQNTAVAGGNVTMDGGSTVTERGVCWSTSAKPTVAGNCVADTSTGTGTFSVTPSGLTASTAYYLRAYAANSYGTVYGADVQFTTLAAVLPTLTTTAVSSVTAATAVSGGDITSDGGAPVTARGVCWSTAVDPATADSCTTDGGGTGTFTSSITGLSPNTLYYVRAYATNSVGTAYGSDQQFTTLQPDFTMALTGSGSATVVPGGTATYHVIVTPVGGVFAAAVTFNATGLPSGASVSFSPSTVPANSSSQTVTVTIKTAPATASSQVVNRRYSSGGLLLAVLLLPLWGVMRVSKRLRNAARWSCLVLLLGGFAAALSIVGCGSFNGYFAQQQQTYNVTIQGSSSGYEHSVTVTLQVE